MMLRLKLFSNILKSYVTAFSEKDGSRRQGSVSAERDLVRRGEPAKAELGIGFVVPVDTQPRDESRLRQVEFAGYVLLHKVRDILMDAE